MKRIAVRLTLYRIDGTEFPINDEDILASYSDTYHEADIMMMRTKDVRKYFPNIENDEWEIPTSEEENTILFYSDDGLYLVDGSDLLDFIQRLTNY